MAKAGAVTPDPILAALASYRPSTEAADELLDINGEIRPVWQEFLRDFAGISADGLTGRIRRGDQYLRDAGVFFRQNTADAADRAWPLSPVPVIIHEDEWRQLSDGLVQRAELLEMIVNDLYGENRLVADGDLPASMVAANPQWLRPMVGVLPGLTHEIFQR